MANLPHWPEIIPSPMITFHVGETGTPIKIHAGVVQALSDPLAELISDEGRDGKPVILEDVDAEKFSVFTEFAYRGTYTTPLIQNSQVMQYSNIEYNEDDDIFDRVPHYLHSAAPVAQTISPARNTSAFYRRFFQEFKSLEFNDVPPMFSVNPNIMFHAKFYVFATKYQVLSLQRQCLSKLHRDLCEFYMNPSDVQILLDLIEYTYTHTTRHELGEESPLRSLVFRYALCQMDKLVGQERFEEIVSRDGGLAIGILRESLKVL